MSTGSRRVRRPRSLTAQVEYIRYIVCCELYRLHAPVGPNCASQATSGQSCEEGTQL